MRSSLRAVLLLALLAIWGSALAAFPALARPTVIVLDHGTGRVLGQDGADEANYPASLTKMMTLYLVFDALRAGRLKLSTPLTVSKHAASMPPSKLGLRPGSRIRVNDAIQALAVKSANDIAVVLAEALGGSEERFAQQMTRVARLKGLRNTTFRNASGLPNLGQMTTARDMAVLARRLIIDFPQYYDYFGRPSFTYGGRTHGNHNRLLATYRGMDGLKTGYIRASGYNLAASAVRDNRRLVAVVLGGETVSERNAIMVQALDSAFGKLAPAAGTIVALQSPAAIVKAKPLVAAPPVTRAAVLEPAAAAQGDADPAQYGVQVGAFGKRRDATRVASKAASLVPKLARAATIDVTRVPNRRALYAARLVGLSRPAADDLCTALKRKKHACFVLKLEDSAVATN